MTFQQTEDINRPLENRVTHLETELAQLKQLLLKSHSESEKLEKIKINPQVEYLIQLHLASGKYSSSEEVLLIALNLLMKLGAEYQTWVEETRQKVAVGIEELDRNEGVDGPTVMNQYMEQFKAAKLPSAS